MIKWCGSTLHFPLSAHPLYHHLSYHIYIISHHHHHISSYLIISSSSKVRKTDLTPLLTFAILTWHFVTGKLHLPRTPGNLGGKSLQKQAGTLHLRLPPWHANEGRRGRRKKENDRQEKKPTASQSKCMYVWWKCSFSVLAQMYGHHEKEKENKWGRQKAHDSGILSSVKAGAVRKTRWCLSFSKRLLFLHSRSNFLVRRKEKQIFMAMSLDSVSYEKLSLHKHKQQQHVYSIAMWPSLLYVLVACMYFQHVKAAACEKLVRQFLRLNVICLIISQSWAFFLICCFLSSCK